MAVCDNYIYRTTLQECNAYGLPVCVYGTLPSASEDHFQSETAVLMWISLL